MHKHKKIRAFSRIIPALLALAFLAVPAAFPQSSPDSAFLRQFAWKQDMISATGSGAYNIPAQTSAGMVYEIETRLFFRRTEPSRAVTCWGWLEKYPPRNNISRFTRTTRSRLRKRCGNGARNAHG